MSTDKTQVRAPLLEWSLRSVSDDSLVALTDGFTVGRSDECDLVLTEGLVSRAHANFSVQGMKLLLIDAESTNGTFVNDEKIESQVLKPGDKVRFDINEFDVLLDTGVRQDVDATMLRVADRSPHSGKSEQERPPESSPESVPDSSAEPTHEPMPESDDDAVVLIDHADRKRPLAQTIDKTQVSPAEEGAERLAEGSQKTAVWQAASVAEGGTVIVAGGGGGTMSAPVRSERREVSLTGLTDPAIGRKYTLSKKKNTVGRSPLNDIILRSASVSSQHAAVELERDEWVLYDCDSSNGSYLNGEQISHGVLASGDIIAFGSVEFEFDAAGKQAVVAPTRDDGQLTEGHLSRFVKLFAVGAIVLSLVFALSIYFQRGGLSTGEPVAISSVVSGGLRELWRNPVKQRTGQLLGPIVTDLDNDGSVELVLADSSGRLLYFDGRTGALGKDIKLNTKLATAPIATAHGAVIVIDDSGTVAAYGGNGQLLWSQVLGVAARAVFTKPLTMTVASTELLIIPTAGMGPIAIEVSSGRKVFDSRAMSDGELITNLVASAATDNQRLFGGVSAGDGSQLVAWTLTPQGISRVWQSPVPAGKQLLTLTRAGEAIIGCTADGELFAYKATNGELMWQLSLHAPVLARAATLAGNLLIPLQSGELAVVQSHSGHLISKVLTGGRLESDIITHGHYAVVAGTNGSVSLHDAQGAMLDRQFVAGADAFVQRPVLYAGQGGQLSLYAISLNGLLVHYSLGGK